MAGRAGPRLDFNAKCFLFPLISSLATSHPSNEQTQRFCFRIRPRKEVYCTTTASTASTPSVLSSRGTRCTTTASTNDQSQHRRSQASPCSTPASGSSRSRPSSCYTTPRRETTNADSSKGSSYPIIFVHAYTHAWKCVSCSSIQDVYDGTCKDGHGCGRAGGCNGC